jgi:hypothetical protein
MLSGVICWAIGLAILLSPSIAITIALVRAKAVDFMAFLYWSTRLGVLILTPGGVSLVFILWLVGGLVAGRLSLADLLGSLAMLLGLMFVVGGSTLLYATVVLASIVCRIAADNGTIANQRARHEVELNMRRHRLIYRAICWWYGTRVDVVRSVVIEPGPVA